MIDSNTQQDVASQSFEILSKAEKINSIYNIKADTYSNELLQAAQREVERIQESLDKERSIVLDDLNNGIKIENKKIEELKNIERDFRSSLTSTVNNYLDKLEGKENVSITNFKFEEVIKDFNFEDDEDEVSSDDFLSIEILINDFISQFEEPTIEVVEDRPDNEHLMITKAYEIYDEYTKESREYLKNITAKAKGIAKTSLEEAYNGRKDDLDDLKDEMKDLRKELNKLTKLRASYNDYLNVFLSSLLSAVEEGVYEENELSENSTLVDTYATEYVDEDEGATEYVDEDEGAIEDVDEAEGATEDVDEAEGFNSEKQDVVEEPLEDSNDFEKVTEVINLEEEKAIASQVGEVELTQNEDLKSEEIDIKSLFNTEEQYTSKDEEFTDSSEDSNVVSIKEENELSANDLYDAAAADADKDEIKDVENMLDGETSTMFSIDD